MNEMSYNEAFRQAQKELLNRLNDDNKVVFGEVLDNPIYPQNKELYDEFVDEYGFDVTEFISYIIRQTPCLGTEFNYDIDELMIVKEA